MRRYRTRMEREELLSDISFEDQTVIVTGAGRAPGRSHDLDLARRDASACHETVATAEGAKHVIDTALEYFGNVDVPIK
jgi:hypothetical protein